MNQILNKLFNKNLSKMKNLSERLDDGRDVEKTIMKNNFKRELDDLGRSLKNVKFGKEMFNSMMNTSATITLNPDNKDVIAGSLSRLSKEFNETFKMQLDDDDIDEIVDENTKFTSILSNMIVPNHIAINNVKSITNEYSYKTRNNYNKMNAEEISKTLNNVSYLTSEINKISSFTSTVNCMNMMLVKAAEKYNKDKRYGLGDLFKNLAANVMAVLKDAYKWDVKEYKDNDFIDNLYGLIQRVFYASVIITTVLGLAMLVSATLSVASSTLFPFLPDAIGITFATIFEFVYDFIGTILTPLSIRVGSAIFSASVLRTLKKLNGFNILSIINSTIRKLIDMSKNIFGDVYKFIDKLLSKIEDISDDDNHQDDENKEETPDEDDEEDILTQISGLANSLNNKSSYNESKKYITRSIAHTYYKSMI